MVNTAHMSINPSMLAAHMHLWGMLAMQTKQRLLECTRLQAASNFKRLWRPLQIPLMLSIFLYSRNVCSGAVPAAAMPAHSALPVGQLQLSAARLLRGSSQRLQASLTAQTPAAWAAVLSPLVTL